MKRIHLTRAEAEGFYAEHKGRGFFDELVAFMSRSPIIVMALERDDAVAKYREVIGATDPAKAAEGTIRKLYGANVGENAAHGSDKTQTAAREIGYFFAGYEVSPRLEPRLRRAGRSRAASVRDGVAAIEHFLQVLASRRVGPRVLARSVPEVRGGCAPLRLALGALELALAGDRRRSRGRRRRAHPARSRLRARERAGAGALRAWDATMDARERLALEAVVRRVAGELSAVVRLVDLLGAPATTETTTID